MKLPLFPIHAVLADIQKTLKTYDQLVLQAPPGAGKTTLVPLALLNERWLRNNKILMLEPRRMAARTAAERMADLLNEKVGETVGYRIRQESRVGEKNRIEVITEGVLTRLLQVDPALEGVGLIIFDEFHERNLNTDLGLALSMQARELFRESDNPLKILVMSATLDTGKIAKLLNDAPQLRSEGKMYPVDIHYGRTFRVNESIIDPVIKTILKALAETKGSILVFLPGQSEIIKVLKGLVSMVSNDVKVLPLYGALTLAEQMQAIIPLQENGVIKRKVVLATDIAETSLTIEGISSVVDSGLSRQPRFDPATGMTRLQTRRISQASSIQRMGRAGRMQAGSCYRLWSEETQKTLEKQIPAEILQADLCPLVLQLLQWGVSDPEELNWMDKPPQAAFSQALDLLYSLNAIKHNPQQLDSVCLTQHGVQMARFPTHPRLAHMLIQSVTINQTKIAASLATLLSDKDPLQHYGNNISAKVDVLLGDIPCEQRFRGWLRRSQQQRKIFEKLCRLISIDEQLEITDKDVIAYLISQAYPDRIGQRRQRQQTETVGSYLLSNGRAAQINANDQLASHEYLAIAELGGQVNQREDKIYAAAGLNPDLFSTLLKPMVRQTETIHWHEQTNRIVAEQQEKIGALVIARIPLRQISLEDRFNAIAQVIRRKGLSVLPWNENTRQWCSRVTCLRSVSADKNGENPWPDVSDENLLDTLDDWLQPYCDSINKMEDLQKLDLKKCFSGFLPWPLTQQLEDLAPLTFKVPSGSVIKIDYSQTPPVLAVKLQEMFGCLQTPTIAGGKISLLVHLLSPARKPLQITQDLAGFWSGSYQEVKKEMKGRYPKHPWPDDPLRAPATRFTTHKKNRKP